MEYSRVLVMLSKEATDKYSAYVTNKEQFEKSNLTAFEYHMLFNHQPIANFKTAEDAISSVNKIGVDYEIIGTNNITERDCLALIYLLFLQFTEYFLPEDKHSLELGRDGSGSIRDLEGKMITCWANFIEGVKSLRFLSINKEKFNDPMNVHWKIGEM